MTESIRAPRWSWLLRRPFHFLLDGAVLASMLVLAFLLRFDFAIPDATASLLKLQIPLVLGVQFATLYACGVYAFIWRYVGIAEITAFLRAAVLAALILIVLRLALPEAMGAARVPLSVILMDFVLAFGGALSLRVLRRVIYERYEGRTRLAGTRKSVLLIGAGRAGLVAVRELAGRSLGELDVKGFVDDDLTKQGSVIHSVPVLGTTRDLARLVLAHDIDHVIITMGRAPRDQMRRILDLCERVPVSARIIPGLAEILEGGVSMTRVRNVEIEDLLGREPVKLEIDAVRAFITEKTVMVTGAGGSIGSELARQIARFRPARLLLVERAEPALFVIDRELRESFGELEIVPLIADVTDALRMESVFRNYGPDAVFHAAAHKHVPMMEHNPGEAIKNNVIGTRTVAELAGRFGCGAFVLISTDKAVNPTSVMGATKRVAELVIQDLDARFAGTRFVAVRFGNVLGSTGSVIPIFREQIQRGGPVTVTHPDMVRYFMTIPEASQLVLQAGAMGEGGEIFVLDMGEPVKIVDLARDMIRLSGFRAGDDIEIVFSGVRPGEKLFEELHMTGEEVTKTRHPKIFIGRIAGIESAELAAGIQAVWPAAQRGDAALVREGLARLVPEATIFGRPQLSIPVPIHMTAAPDARTAPGVPSRVDVVQG